MITAPFRDAVARGVSAGGGHYRVVSARSRPYNNVIRVRAYVSLSLDFFYIFIFPLLALPRVGFYYTRLDIQIRRLSGQRAAVDQALACRHGRGPCTDFRAQKRERASER